MRSATFLLLLNLAVVALARAGVRVGDEITLFADGPGNLARGTPAAAFGKGIYLAVWREGWHGKGGNARIYASRLNIDGKVLDPEGIAISACGKGVQTLPSAAFAGNVFLVVWQDFCNGKDYDILAARVSLEGQVLDTEPIRIAAAPRSQVLPDVASDDDGFLVVWQGIRGRIASYGGFAAPVSADGDVGVTVETGASPQPLVAWNGRRFLVAYGGREVKVKLLDRDGTPVDPAERGKRILRQAKALRFSIAAARGGGWLVVNHRSPPDNWGWGGPGAIRTAFVRPDGTLENSNAIKEPAGNWSKLPNWLDVTDKPAGTWPWGQSAVAFDGQNFLAVWQRFHKKKSTALTNPDIFASRVSNWRPVDADGVPVATSSDGEKNPALASNGTHKLLCVYERHGKDGNVRIAARVLETLGGDAE